jgi:hypothetical protein
VYNAIVLQRLFSDSGNAALLRNLFRALAVALAGMHAWAAIISQSMNADGISYLDIGDAYFRGDWVNAINPVWPPLYSWILGLVNFVVKPPMAWEYPTVHIVNFFIFLVAMVSFEFMWRRLRRHSSSYDQAGVQPIPAWAWWSIGYSLFIWTSLALIQIWAVTPDMLMASLVYLSAGLVSEIRHDSRRWAPFILLGIVLGLGFLAKTVMLTTALIILVMCLVVVPLQRVAIAKVFTAAGVFLLICLPFIIMISYRQGKFTIGEAGNVTYLRYVQGIPFPHWQSDPVWQIRPSHPTRIIHSSPPIYEFGQPIGGTYPISTDPSYWFEGIHLPFNLKNQLMRLLVSSLFYIDLFFKQQGLMVASFIALYWMGARQKLSPRSILRQWVLVIPAVAAFGLYGLVLVSGRYIGVFVLLFWADLLANLRLVDKSANREWLRVLSAIAVVGLLVNIGLFNLDGVTRLNPERKSSIGEQTSAKPPGPVLVAQALQQLGVQEGDRVAIIGYGFDSFWARLARVQIVAEMLDTEAGDFWHGDDAARESVLLAFASTGAKAVVAEYVPDDIEMKGWAKVGNSNYYIYRIEE